MNQPLVAIVIVGYNSRSFLEDCFSSIFSSDYANLKIIFVDNASTDGSAEFVQSHFPKVDVIASKENNGFAKGNNIGIKRAFEEKPKFIFLLNPDTVIDKDCLGKLVKQSASSDNTILQPLVLLYEKGKTDLINTTGNHLNYLGISYVSDYRKKSSEAKNGPIVSASGAAMWWPAEVLHKVGFFDESFFLYHEDLDLCWRARIAGYDVQLVPDAHIWHKYRFSSNKQKLWYVERNRLLFLLKDFEVKTLVLIAPMFLVNELLTCLFALKGGWLKSKLGSYGSVIKLLPAVAKERRAIKRRVSDHQLKKLLSSKINFAEVKVPLAKQYNFLLNGYWQLIERAI